MTSAQAAILAVIATPILILARDAFNRRREPRQLLLALAVLLAIVANIVVTVGLQKG